MDALECWQDHSGEDWQDQSWEGLQDYDGEGWQERTEEGEEQRQEDEELREGRGGQGGMMDDEATNQVSSKDKRKTGTSTKRKQIEKEKEKGREARTKLEKNSRNNKRKFAQKITIVGGDFLCKFCPFKTINRHLAKQHSRSWCGEEERPPKAKKRHTKKIHCALCDLEFSKAADRNTHNRAVHVRSLPCSYCGKMFRNQETLNKHLQEFHSNTEKKFKCNLCDFKSHRSYDLKRHMRAKHAADAVSRPEVRASVEEHHAEMGELTPVKRIRSLGSGVFLVNISSRKVHIVNVHEQKFKEEDELVSFSTDFDITCIVEHPESPRLVAISSSRKITIYSFSSEETGSNLLKMGLMVVPSSMLPSQPFTISWIPAKLGVALVAGSTVLTLLTSPEAGIKKLGNYSVEDNLCVASVTFHDDIIFVLTLCGRVFFGQASLEDGGETKLTQQIEVNGSKISATTI